MSIKDRQGIVRLTGPAPRKPESICLQSYHSLSPSLSRYLNPQDVCLLPTPHAFKQYWVSISVPRSQYLQLLLLLLLISSLQSKGRRWRSRFLSMSPTTRGLLTIYTLPFNKQQLISYICKHNGNCFAPECLDGRAVAAKEPDFSSTPATHRGSPCTEGFCRKVVVPSDHRPMPEDEDRGVSRG